MTVGSPPTHEFDRVFRAGNGVLVSVWHPHGIRLEAVREALAEIQVEVAKELAGLEITARSGRDGGTRRDDRGRTAAGIGLGGTMTKSEVPSFSASTPVAAAHARERDAQGSADPSHPEVRKALDQFLARFAPHSHPPE